MKSGMKGFIAGTILSTVFMGSIVLGTNVELRNLAAEFCNISIDIDQGQFVPKDATGKEVEPFIVDGTTYLPVRAIAEAFDKNVEWDGETKRVKIFTKSEEVTSQEVEDAFEEVYLSDKTLKEYKINGVEKVDVNTWTVSYSVLPTKGNETQWIAGNGELTEDGWIKDKMLFVYAVKTDGELDLGIIGTGL